MRGIGAHPYQLLLITKDFVGTVQELESWRRRLVRHAEPGRLHASTARRQRPKRLMLGCQQSQDLMAQLRYESAYLSIPAWVFVAIAAQNHGWHSSV